MRKRTIFIALNLCGLLIVYLFYNSCNKSDTTNNKTMQAKQLSINTAVASGVTLNGVSLADAKNMVARFRKDSSNSDARTSIWLSRKWVETTYAILEKEGADGLRIYFAKSNNHRNTIVIVSTKDSNSYHLDYFTHTNPFFTSTAAQFKEEYNLKSLESRFYATTSPCQGTDCTIPAIDKHSINCKDAYNYISNFYNNGHPSNINTYIYWIEISLLNNFIAKFKEIDLSNKADGIRLYFAKIPDNQSNNINSGKNTIVFVTTIASDNLHQDYYKCTTIHSNTAINGMILNTSSTTDKGELCPPGDCVKNGATLLK